MDAEDLRTAFSESDYVKVHHLCDSALQLNASDLWALYWRAQAFRMQGYLQLSADSFGEAFHSAKATGTSDDVGIVGLAYGILLQQTDPQRAIAIFRTALKRKPNNSPLLCNSLGIALRRIGDEARALDVYAEGIRLELDAIVASYRINGLWGVSTNGGRESIWLEERLPERLVTEITSNRSMPAILANVARILIDRKEMNRARKVISRALLLGDPNGNGARILAETGSSIGDAELHDAMEELMDHFVKAAIRFASDEARP